jgi:hypothetical protein
MMKKRVESSLVVEAINAALAAMHQRMAPQYGTLARPGYSLPMAWRSAIGMSNKLVDSVPRYSSADHGSIFKALLALVSGVLDVHKGAPIDPHFDFALEHDQAIQSCLQDEFDQLFYRNMAISLDKGYWRLLYDENSDSFRLSLAPPQRRSALTLIDHKAEFLSMPPELQEIVAGASSGAPQKTVPLTLATGMREVMFLAGAVPKAWNTLSSQLGFTLDEAILFQAFTQALLDTGILWFRASDLLTMFGDFAKAQDLKPIDEHSFYRLLDFFSAPPRIIDDWGIAVPFIRFGDWLAYWPFVHHILPPSLTFLSLLMRKHPDDWNNTVGSELAKVANAIRDQLPNKTGLLFVTMKKKTGVGDIDLGIYNPQSRVLLLCEIKTVFDRFRTNYQQSNFTDQRVNFDKALKQLNAASTAIARGDWRLSDIFGVKLDGPPALILELVLTWYDQHNAWLGLAAPHPSSCNFRVFNYLFTKSGGDLMKIHEAIAQLSRIYCVAALPSSWQLPVNGGTVLIKREVQTDALPPREALSSMPLSDFVRQEIEPLAKFPADWKKQLEARGQKDAEYHIYGFDES